MAFWSVGLAVAEDAATAAKLSDQEKAAIGSILDSLTTRTGTELKDSIVHDIDGLSNNGKSAESVVSAVKMGAGPKLPQFQDILVSKCLGTGGKGYCRLAALPAPQTQSSDITTSSTGGGAGGGDGGGGAGGGGGSQTNFGRNSQNYLTSANPLFGNDQQFSFNAASFPTTATSTTALISTGSSIQTIAAPGPQAGAGLGSALLFAGGWLLARLNRSKQTV